jgi:hypothetical protein
MGGGIKGFVKNLFTDWRESLFSLRGASVVLFMTMIIIIMFGGRICDSVNKEKKARMTAEKELYDYEVLSNIRNDSGFVERPIVGTWENVC